MLAGQLLAEGDGGELAVGRRQPHRGRPLDELLVAAAVLDQVGDGDELQPVLLAVRDQVAHARHRPVVVHHLADDAGRVQAREPGEVDRGLGLAAAPQHAARACPQREDVAGLDEVAGALARVDRDLDRARAVLRGDAGRDPLARLDRDREGGAEGRLVALGHRLQPQLVAALLGQAEADQPAAVRGHEVDRLGRRELGRDRQVALVLAVGGVDDDHEPAVADVLDRLLDGGEGGGAVGRVHLAVDRNPQAEASRSAYFASRSTSTLTSSPGPSAPRVVCSSVNGTSAISTPSSSSAAIVSETPSTASEPFSTQ